MSYRAILKTILFLCISGTSFAQGSNPELLTLEDCLRFALKHQPALKQSLIDEAIARTNNSIALSTWLPQVNGSANIQHYFQLPVAFIPDGNGNLTKVNTGLIDVSTPAIAATQNIFSTDAVLAMRASKLNTLQAKQSTVGTKIGLVSDVTKGFYSLLLTLQQITVLKEDTARLNKNQQDAYHQYVSGIVDKVDYKQATISLNNTLAELKTATEGLNAKYAVLKQLMGYPTEKDFTVSFDTVRMMQEVYLDTNAQLEVEKRIEFQELMTQKRIQKETTAYYQLGFIPSVNAFYNYNYVFESNQFSDLYDNAYPNSLIGVQLNVPLFTGFRRIENIHKSKLQEQRTDWDVVNLKLQIHTEYTQALTNYKSSLYNLHAMGDNVSLAKEVYEIVKLQYREGIKTYLNVITAESDLRTSEINYLNALFQLLSAKIDLEKAMGDLATDIG